jgi:6-pyruvoyltetrahydropterin/6-carboxytetrahydropterin synthase
MPVTQSLQAMKKGMVINMYNQYKFKFYLNASHAIYIDGSMGERHPHTWEITINVLKKRDEFIQFTNIEMKMEQWMKKYQDRFLNEIPPFDNINPTMENLCDYFKDILNEMLFQEEWILLMIEMSETPTRSYVVNLMEYDYPMFIKKNSEVIADKLLANILNE